MSDLAHFDERQRDQPENGGSRQGHRMQLGNLRKLFDTYIAIELALLTLSVLLLLLAWTA
jgi:hypothetical protein